MKKFNRNVAVDIFRYISALMVVAIHIHPFTDLNSTMGFICTQVLPRIAVPYFFAISGYFYIKKT